MMVIDYYQIEILDTTNQQVAQNQKMNSILELG